jgi:hypothetical protein
LYITNRAIKFGIEKKIILLCLLLYTTYILQPLDLKIFVLLANIYCRGIQNRYYLRATYSINKIIFLEVFQEVQEKAITKKNIKSAWAAASLNLFNPAIVLDKLLSNQKSLQLLASPIIKAKNSILLPFISKNILQVEVLIYQVIENNNLDTKRFLLKLGKLYTLYLLIYLFGVLPILSLLQQQSQNTKSVLDNIIVRQG